MEFHHVGIATADAARTARRFGALFDLPERHREEIDDIDVRFLALEDGTYLELLEPLDGGPVARFLDRRGEGIHHLGFATEAIEDRLALAAEAGVELIDDTPRPGAWGSDVAFLHPRDTGGVLIELVAV